MYLALQFAKSRWNNSIIAYLIPNKYIVIIVWKNSMQNKETLNQTLKIRFDSEFWNSLSVESWNNSTERKHPWHMDKCKPHSIEYPCTINTSISNASNGNISHLFWRFHYRKTSTQCFDKSNPKYSYLMHRRQSTIRIEICN